MNSTDLKNISIKTSSLKNKDFGNIKIKNISISVPNIQIGTVDFSKVSQNLINFFPIEIEIKSMTTDVKVEVSTPKDLGKEKIKAPKFDFDLDYEKVLKPYEITDFNKFIDASKAAFRNSTKFLQSLNQSLQSIIDATEELKRQVFGIQLTSDIDKAQNYGAVYSLGFENHYKDQEKSMFYQLAKPDAMRNMFDVFFFENIGEDGENTSILKHPVTRGSTFENANLYMLLSSRNELLLSKIL